MKVISVLIILSGLAVPVHAAEKLSPLTTEFRNSFIKAMKKSYDPKCNCAIFLYKKRILEVDISPSDSTIRLMIDALKNGTLVPLETKHIGAPS